MRTALKFVLAATLSVAVLSPLLGADWPCWRGPAGSGVSAEKGLLGAWPKAGPELVWKSKVAGNGYAGMAVVGGVVYTMGAVGDDEFAIALDDKGQKLWSTKIGPVHDWNVNRWSRGPNATPTVDGEFVYCLGSMGDLLCCKKADGAKVWSKNLPKEYSAEVNDVGGGVEKFGWGFNWSPIVDGDKLVLTTGGPKGLFTALDKKKGDTLWQSKAVTDQATYVTPTIATIGGVKQYVTLTQSGVVAVAAANGDLLWRWKRNNGDYPDVVCPTPIVQGNLVYASAGTAGGFVLLKIEGGGKKFTFTEVATDNTIGNRQGGVVLIDGYLYGFHEDRNWACQEFATGNVVYGARIKRKVASGALVAADGKLFSLDEAGFVEMGVASPKGYKVLSTFELPEHSKTNKKGGKVWTHPSISDGKLYLRDQELVFCYQVK